VTGALITFEGIEGVGKSTNAKFLAAKLLEQGLDVVVTREPGGTKVGELIRAILIENTLQPTAMTELLLLFAARAQHISEVIQPALKAGKIVLCDRFTDASYAYQGGGRGIPLTAIASLEQMVQQGLHPDLILLFDAPAEVGLNRAKERGKYDRFEQEKLEFFQRVRQTYLERSRNAANCIVLDASQSLSQVQNNLSDLVSEIVDKANV